MKKTLADINIRTFMKCLFNKDYSEVGEENWDDLYTSYIDLSGFGEGSNLSLYVHIHNLTVRLTHIAGWIEIQSKFFQIFKLPHLPSFDDIKQYGHRPVWPSDNFMHQLVLIESKEKRNKIEIRRMEKELKQLQETQDPNTTSARNQFVIMLNVLGKEGYKIDKDKTDMEELALMIKQHGEDMAALKKQNI